MLGIEGVAKEALEFLDTEHLGETLVIGPWREVEA
jgi:hypothetical protein